MKKIIPSTAIVIVISIVGIFLLIINSKLPDSNDSLITQHLDASNEFTLIKKYPKNPINFTEGLFINEGILYESCGLYGKSKIYRNPLDNSNKSEYEFTQDIFAEGSCILKDSLFCLSYKENRYFEFDPLSLEKLNESFYPYEGWGLTTDGISKLYASDGSSNIYVFESTIDSPINILSCHTDTGEKMSNINELEYVNGKIYANIFLTNNIVLIDAETGFIEKIYDFSTIINEYHNDKNSVLNGIAYNADTQSFLVTGKNYNYYYELEYKN